MSFSSARTSRGSGWAVYGVDARRTENAVDFEGFLCGSVERLLQQTVSALRSHVHGEVEYLCRKGLVFDPVVAPAIPPVAAVDRDGLLAGQRPDVHAPDNFASICRSSFHPRDRSGHSRIRLRTPASSRRFFRIDHPCPHPPLVFAFDLLCDRSGGCAEPSPLPAAEPIDRFGQDPSRRFFHVVIKILDFF